MMGRPSIPERPQTLRQAKRAFRKSSAKPKLSPQELALAERRAVLQGRADKIREKEARKKANAKKREEKKEKERETCLRMGRAPPKEGAFKITSSQLDLTKFIPASEKKESNGSNMQPLSEFPETRKASITNDCVQPSGQRTPSENVHSPISQKMMPPPRRSPLKEVSSNCFRKPLFPASVAKVPVKVQPKVPDDLADMFVSNTQIERELTPPRPFQRAPQSRYLGSAGKSPQIRKVEDPSYFLAMICTQDLEYTLTQAAPTIVPSSINSKPAIYTNEEDEAADKPNDHIGPISEIPEEFHISSQDLDMSELSQDSQKSQDYKQERLEPSSKTSSFDFGGDFTDQELNGLVEEVEVNSSRTEINFSRDKVTPPKTPISTKVEQVPLLPCHAENTTPVTPANEIPDPPSLCSCRDPQCLYPRYGMEHGLTDKAPRLPNGEYIYMNAWEDDECWDEEICSNVSQQPRESLQGQGSPGGKSLVQEDFEWVKRMTPEKDKS